MVQTRYEPVKPKKKIEENKINLHIRKKNSNFAGEYTQNVFQRKIHPYFKIKMDMETLHENADITLKSEESCTAIENEKVEDAVNIYIAMTHTLAERYNINMHTLFIDEESIKLKTHFL